MGLYGMRLHTVAVMSETSSTLVRSREANLRAGGAAPPVAYTHATSLTPILLSSAQAIRAPWTPVYLWSGERLVVRSVGMAYAPRGWEKLNHPVVRRPRRSPNDYEAMEPDNTDRNKQKWRTNLGVVKTAKPSIDGKQKPLSKQRLHSHECDRSYARTNGSGCTGRDGEHTSNK